MILSISYEKFNQESISYGKYNMLSNKFVFHKFTQKKTLKDRQLEIQMTNEGVEKF